MPQPNHDYLLIQRLHRHKQVRAGTTLAVGDEIVSFFKQSIEKKHAKVGKVAGAWMTLVPPSLNDHCTLDGLSRGVLTVLVDSSSHLYELKQLLLAGIEKQLVLACKAAHLKKVVLRPGKAPEVGEVGPAQGRGLTALLTSVRHVVAEALTMANRDRRNA